MHAHRTVLIYTSYTYMLSLVQRVCVHPRKHNYIPKSYMHETTGRHGVRLSDGFETQFLKNLIIVFVPLC